jgi:hypothetical protein
VKNFKKISKALQSGGCADVGFLVIAKKQRVPRIIMVKDAFIYLLKKCGFLVGLKPFGFATRCAKILKAIYFALIGFLL